MQKTVCFDDIDGYKVIRTFSEASVDPEATNAKTKELILKLPEVKAVNDQKAKIAQQQLIINNLSGFRRKLNAVEQKQLDAAQKAISQLYTDLGPLEAAANAAKQKCWIDNRAFFNPGPGEGFISDADYTTLSEKFNALPPNTKLQIDGTEISDNRGRSYWVKGKKWTQTQVSTLGETIPSGAIFDEDLTDAQRGEIATQMEAARVAALTSAEKLAEATSAQKQAKMAVVDVQTEVTAGVSSQADLEAAQANYKTVLANINAKYGTSLT